MKIPFFCSKTYLLIFTVMLAGCSLTPTTPEAPATPWAAHKAQIESLSTWQAAGKLGIKVDGQYTPVTFNWDQTNKNYQVTLTAPFGQGTATISGNEYSASLSLPNERPMEAGSAEELLTARFGWQIPVQNAQYWIRGIPAPDTAFKAIFEHQKLSTLHQDGWTIIYKKHAAYDGLNLPKKMTLSRNDINLTVFVRNWQMQAE